MLRLKKKEVQFISNVLVTTVTRRRKTDPGVHCDKKQTQTHTDTQLHSKKSQTLLRRHALAHAHKGNSKVCEGHL